MTEKKKYLDYEAIKKAVSIQDVLKHYDLTETISPVHGADNIFRGKCLICQEDKADPFRLVLEEDSSYFYCVDCSAFGNVLDFVAKIEKTDIHESAFLLHEWFSLSPEPPANGERKPAADGKGYLRQLDKELRKLLEEGDDDATIRFVKEKILESYRNGQKVEKVSA